MKKIQRKEDFQVFQTKYEAISGLKLPLPYLEKSDVYVFRRKDNIIGGFILGNRLPLRTVEVFVSKPNLKVLSPYFEINKYCEVCCFWIERKLRRNAFFNALFWIRMAYSVKRQSKEFILFGTNSKGLAKMYGYPKNSLLFHKDNVGNKDTYVFLARRKDFAGGVWEIVLSKILKRARNRDFENKLELKTALVYELSK